MVPAPPEMLAFAGVVLLVVAYAVLSRARRRAERPDEASPGSDSTESAIIHGHLTLRRATRFTSGVRLLGDLEVEREAHVTGPLMVAGDATLDADATVENLLDVEGDVRLAPGARVDRIRAGGQVMVEEGARLQHGGECGRLILIAAHRRSDASADDET